MSYSRFDDDALDILKNMIRSDMMKVTISQSKSRLTNMVNETVKVSVRRRRRLVSYCSISSMAVMVLSLFRCSDAFVTTHRTFSLNSLSMNSLELPSVPSRRVLFLASQRLQGRTNKLSVSMSWTKKSTPTTTTIYSSFLVPEPSSGDIAVISSGRTATSNCLESISSTSSLSGPTSTLSVVQEEDKESRSAVEVSQDIIVPLYQLALAGALATFIADVGMHPIDTVKTVLQNAAGSDTTFFQALEQILNNGGIRALYGGFLTYATSDALGGAIKFAIWEAWNKCILDSKNVFKNHKNNKIISNDNKCESSSICNNAPSKEADCLGQNDALFLWIGAALSFVGSSIVIVPGEYLKQQLQVSHYDSIQQAVLTTYMTLGGLSAFYTGYEGVLYRDVPYTVIELSLYEALKRFADHQRFQQQKQQPHSISSQHQRQTILEETQEEANKTFFQDTVCFEQIGAAAVTGAVASFVTAPLDAIKTQLMVGVASTTSTTTSFLDCLLDTISTHGPAATFAGVSARVAWIVPFTVLYLPMYDYFKRLLLQQQQQKKQQQAAQSS